MTQAYGTHLCGHIMENGAACANRVGDPQGPDAKCSKHNGTKKVVVREPDVPRPEIPDPRHMLALTRSELDTVRYALELMDSTAGNVLLKRIRFVGCTRKEVRTALKFKGPVPEELLRGA